MHRSGLLLALALGCGVFAACTVKSSGGEGPGVDFEMDSGIAFDGTTSDGEPDAEPEAAVEASAQDASVADVGPEEASIPEASAPDVEMMVEASLPEAAAPEAGAPEASIPDAGAPEVLVEAAAPEAGPQDASVDAVEEVAAEASVTCIANVIGDHYLRADGTLVYAPNGTHTLIVDQATSLPLQPMLEVVQQMNDHACGLRGDGTVWCWPLNTSGGNTDGDLGNGSVGGTGAIGAATQVVTNAAGDGGPSYLTGVVHLSTASDTFYTFPTCAIRADKTVWCWGFSTGQTSSDGLFQGAIGSSASVPYAVPIPSGPSDGGPPPIATADQVSVGGRHACLLLAGQVSCWGDNVAGNLGDGDPSLAFKPYPVPVVTGQGLPATVDAIGCGYDFTCALASGSVWCWGTDSWHQMGNPSEPTMFCNLNYCQPAPVPVQQSAPDGGSTQVPEAGTDQDPLVGITKLLVGYQFACGLDSGGNIWCWGSRYAGSQYVQEAVPFTSATVPTTDVVTLSASGEDMSALRYTTASGVYVSGNQEYTPYCQ